MTPAERLGFGQVPAVGEVERIGEDALLIVGLNGVRLSVLGGRARVAHSFEDDAERIVRLVRLRIGGHGFLEGPLRTGEIARRVRGESSSVRGLGARVHLEGTAVRRLRCRRLRWLLRLGCGRLRRGSGAGHRGFHLRLRTAATDNLAPERRRQKGKGEPGKTSRAHRAPTAGGGRGWGAGEATRPGRVCKNKPSR